MTFDAIVIGGSFAGLSAAMQLARARRRVLVVDSGLPRNRFAAASHGFFGQDGRPPLLMRDEARRQLALYPTVSFADGEATEAQQSVDGFRLSMTDGRNWTGARLILATGVRDELPPIVGIEARWGRTVLHCPYCHGYELGEARLGVLANHPASAHQAMLIPEWGPTTYFTQGVFEPDAEQLARLAIRGVVVERSPIVELLGAAPGLEAVRLADGRTMPIGALFTAPTLHMTSPLAEQLGCAFEAGPVGRYIRTDERRRSSIPGVYAAGDAANPMHNATISSASGVLAGVGTHHSLFMETN
ncbi:thioredoxin reductase [Kaistia algarum]|uniref:NAD(P)/FAD-dependent oxidoreductase n=1 Tax=Kaistia algarum TaxID=2083279 RepID=UPI000CE7FB58|nr:NAD(P)/FAD-dependent oxidoreductase [Kaistia algarum]MCX5515212.1 NAD(P)/FAD-dependent oxidoreductase [Kaistia algarum]PPE79927.1 thioredoxin reductase [Kaistia algarum]